MFAGAAGTNPGDWTFEDRFFDKRSNQQVSFHPTVLLFWHFLFVQPTM